MSTDRKGQRVRATSAVAAAQVTPSVTFTIGTHLWMAWLQIATERERAAAEARADGVASHAAGEGFGNALSDEMHASMVAISGAAHAIDALYGEIKPLVPMPAATTTRWDQNRTARYVRIFET